VYNEFSIIALANVNNRTERSVQCDTLEDKMDYTISDSTTFPIAEIHIARGETMQIESGAMIYHNGQVKLDGHMNSNGKGGLGGMMRALGRSMTSGESFFITTATGIGDDSELGIAPANPGVIWPLRVGNGTQLRLNTGAFLAADPEVTYNMVRQKLSGALFGGTGGLFVMETAGTGTLLVSGYGDIIVLELDGSKEYVVDNSHVVAWDQNLDYDIEVASGTFGFTTGEGLVNHFHGQGKVYVQTRNLESLANSLKPYLPSSKD
jgi:uncharacterized protein (TIGR00266 family)